MEMLTIELDLQDVRLQKYYIDFGSRLFDTFFHYPFG